MSNAQSNLFYDILPDDCQQLIFKHSSVNIIIANWYKYIDKKNVTVLLFLKVPNYCPDHLAEDYYHPFNRMLFIALKRMYSTITVFDDLHFWSRFLSRVIDGFTLHLHLWEDDRYVELEQIYIAVYNKINQKRHRVPYSHIKDTIWDPIVVENAWGTLPGT